MTDIDRDQAALREAAAKSRRLYEPEQKGALQELIVLRILAGISIPAIVVPILVTWEALSVSGLLWVAASVLAGAAGLAFSAYRAGRRARFEALEKQNKKSSAARIGRP